MGSAIGVEYLVATGLGQSSQQVLIAMLLGSIVALMGSLGLTSGSVAEQARSAALFPVAIGLGLTAGAAVGANTDLVLGVFVAVIFVAVYVRRFGMPFFFAGFMIWMGYFFGSFLGATYSQLPGLIGSAVLAAAWVFVLSITVLRGNPHRVLDSTIRAFTVRVQEMAAAASQLLRTGDDRTLRRLARHRARMDEAALLIEGRLDETALPPGRSPAAVRRWLVDTQLAADDIAAAVEVLAHDLVDLPARRRVAVVLAHLAADELELAVAAVDQLDLGTEGHATGQSGRSVAHALRHLRAGLLGYATSRQAWQQPLEPDRVGDDEVFTPSVTLMLGRLPTSTAVAKDLDARGAHWNPLARLPLTTRQAIQTAVAGGLAIAAGRQLSQQRYYWAVIAAFVAFTGTATRGDTVAKAVNRVLGTAAGLVVAVWVAELTAGSSPAVLSVILVSVFFAFYLQQISYAYMIFFITIMIAQLYSVLHEFSGGLLVLRLEETAIGGAVGILVATVLLPVSTRDTGRAARANFFVALRELLDGVAARARGHEPDADPEQLARAVEARLHEVRQVMHPLTKPLALRSDATQIRSRLAVYASIATAARVLARATRTMGNAPQPHLTAAFGSLRHAAELLASHDDPTRPLAAVAAEITLAVEQLDAAADDDEQHRLSAVTGAATRLARTFELLAAVRRPVLAGTDGRPQPAPRSTAADLAPH